MSIGRPLLDDARFTWNFAVDGTPPVIEVVSPQPAAPICSPVPVTGRIETGLASVTVDGEDRSVSTRRETSPSSSTRPRPARSC